MPCPDLVAIAGGTSDQTAKAVRHIGDLAVSRHDGKAASGFHRYRTYLLTSVKPYSLVTEPDGRSILLPWLSLLARAIRAGRWMSASLTCVVRRLCSLALCL